MKKLFKTHAKLCIAVLALALVTVGGTLALMAVSSNSVINSFTAASIDTEIKEVLTDGDKQVSITNKGSSDAYVRARIMVSGVKSTDVVIVDQVPNTAEPNKVYLVMQNNGSASGQWSKESSSLNDTYSDAFYYYLGSLGNNENTSNLLEKVVLGSTLAADQNFLKDFTVTIYHESVLAIDQPESMDVTFVKNALTNAVPTTNPGA